MEQQLKQEVLNLGFEKYKKLMEQAVKIVKKANLTNSLGEADKQAFLKIPLLIRQKAIEQVQGESL